MNRDAQQTRLDRAQALYREWTLLQPKLQAAERDWQQACRLIGELTDFYEQHYAELAAAEAAGRVFDTATAGEHSVLCEDTVWNALADQQQQAWQRLHQAIAFLHPQPKDETTPPCVPQP